MVLLFMIQLVITIALIGVILLQQSDGGGLGLGSGHNALFTVRGTANLLTRVTAFLAVLFIGNCLLMTVIASRMIKAQNQILGGNTKVSTEAVPQSQKRTDLSPLLDQKNSHASSQPDSQLAHPHQPSALASKPKSKSSKES
jgi:preprotein translocase subunit SecG